MKIVGFSPSGVRGAALSPGLASFVRRPRLARGDRVRVRAARRDGARGPHGRPHERDARRVV